MAFPKAARPAGWSNSGGPQRLAHPGKGRSFFATTPKSIAPAHSALDCDLRAIARALGGEVCGGQVRAPGPGHSRSDRSLSIKLSASSPVGFLVHSFAGDPWQDCADHACQLLGIERPDALRPPTEPYRRPAAARREDGRPREKTAHALSVWAASTDPRGSIVQRYLNSRELDLGDDIAGIVLRWNPGVAAMVALFRNVHTNEPQAISQTFLDSEGRKIGRKFLGPVAGRRSSWTPTKRWRRPPHRRRR